MYEPHKFMCIFSNLFDVGVIFWFCLTHYVDLLFMHGVYSLVIVLLSSCFLIWPIGRKAEVIVFINSKGGGLSCKTLLFSDLILLADILELFELMNTLEGLYFLPLARFKLTSFTNLETLITYALLVWVSC